MRSSKLNSDHGFTIVELMIATAVLSVILVLVTAIMISINNLYYKGITESREQDNVSSIMDDVSKQIELSYIPKSTSLAYFDSATMITTKSTCFGSIRYSYVINKQVGTQTPQQSPHVLWRDTVSDGTCPNIDPVNGQAIGTTAGYEMIAPGSMLTSFNITGTLPTGTSPYNIAVSTAYGDGSLLIGTGYTSTCKGGAGDQFCATASLSTTVVQRL